ncbi:MAG: topology modulation protein [Oscillospiraceae bacterium]|nr:topology modulation protein [Oscillospiraceae bacterium]
MNFDFSKYNKIILVGSGGSGKSWLSKRIAEIVGYPLYHLDVEHWKPGWVMPPKEERAAWQREIMSGEKWIIDGNYHSTLELRFAAADLIVFLDINRVICLISAIKRQGKKRSDLPDYLEEKLFSKDFFEFLKWIWGYPKNSEKGQKTIMDLHEKYPEKEFLRIKSRKSVNKLIKENSHEYNI